MMFSAVGMGACMAITAGTASQLQEHQLQLPLLLRLSSCSVSSFPSDSLVFPFLYAAEISPTSYRVPITALSTGMSIVCLSIRHQDRADDHGDRYLPALQLLVAEVTPVGFSTIGYRYFIV